MHTAIAIAVFGIVCVAPVCAGELLGRTSRRSLGVPRARSPEVYSTTVTLFASLMSVLEAAQGALAICPRCHLDGDDACVCQDRRRSLAVAVTRAEEALRCHHALESGGMLDPGKVQG